MHEDHKEPSLNSGTRLKITLGILLTIMVVEVAGGLISGSLALVGDAGHMLVDAAALGLSLFAITLARRPATQTKTYGFHRAEIMAALTNGALLILVSIYIFYEAYQRFFRPAHIETSLMLIVASFGLVANLAGLLLLRGASQRSLNIKAAFWHIISDTVSSVGVVLAAIIISFTGWTFVDPIIAIFIGGLVLRGAVQVIIEASDILLEGVPRHIRMEKVLGAVKSTAGVKDMHDVHIWTITTGIYALSAYLVIDDQMLSLSGDILARVNRRLNDDFNITHTTLQLECDSCPTGLACNLRPPHER